MIDGFKPNLAADCKGDVSKLKFPLCASPKIDGVRCILSEGHAWSRSLKHIPNRFVQTYLANVGATLGATLDGELVVGPANAPNVMQATMSGVMSADGEPDFTYYVFDSLHASDLNNPFISRNDELEYWFENCKEDFPRIKLVRQELIYSPEELLLFEQRTLADGFEGIMVRDLSGIYKFGRSTLREGGLIKVKRFSDGEGVIVGLEEEMHNANEAKIDALGRTERSSHRENLVGKGRLGAFRVTGLGSFNGVEFSVGTGFSADQREAFWNAHAADPGAFVGKICKYRYFAHGVVDAPRHPVFVGFRSPEDM